jgi:hypothetical protein
MRAARFVTLCFIYSGLIFLAQYATIYGTSFEVAGLAQLGVGLSILAAGGFQTEKARRGSPESSGVRTVRLWDGSTFNIHEVNLAEQFADRILGLSDGELVFEGSTDELDENAKNKIYRADRSQESDNISDDKTVVSENTKIESNVEL